MVLSLICENDLPLLNLTYSGEYVNFNFIGSVLQHIDKGDEYEML